MLQLIEKTFLIIQLKVVIWKDMITYQRIINGQGDDYTTGCLLDFPRYTQHYKMISIDLSKQKPLDVCPKAIQYSKLILQEI